MRFTHAITRRPGPSLIQGLSTSNLGTPDVEIALSQHAAYCEALRDCGLKVMVLRDDPRFPDGTFVEDVAIVTARGAMLTRPGAPSRREEVEGIRHVLGRDFDRLAEIVGDGTLDGGDVCEADGCYWIGVGGRTNEEGVRQAASWIESLGYSSRTVDLRGTAGLLHLKSGACYLGEGRVAVVAALADEPALGTFERVIVPSAEAYAANCVRVNDQLLIARGFPEFERILRGLGYRPVALDVSEFRKLDGGLSCLSLRY